MIRTGEMESPFNKLGLAITFSPTGKALLKEAKRLKLLFNASLYLIHVGKKSPEREKQLHEVITNAGLASAEIEIIWTLGEPGNAILNAARSAGINLLIAGALEKENIIKYYIGSVARRIMRDAECPVLILKSPSDNPQSFKKFFVSTDFSEQSEFTIRKTYQFAMLDQADELVIIRDYRIPGLASAVQDSGNIEELENIRGEWQQEEEEKMRIFLRELNLKGIKVSSYCLYGREGWRAGNFAKEQKADIYAINVQARKLKLIDRIFPHEAEYTFEQLPANLLIIRK
jgi:nucleotide-binding universal stress UspA family protein